MSILKRPGWNNIQLIDEARGAGDPLHRRIQGMYQKDSLQGCAYYVIKKVIDYLRRTYKDKPIDELTDDEIKEGMSVVTALSRPPTVKQQINAPTNEEPIIKAPELRTGGSYEQDLQATIDKARDTRHSNIANNELNATISQVGSPNTAIIEIIASRDLSPQDLQKVKDFFNMQDIETDRIDNLLGSGQSVTSIDIEVPRNHALSREISMKGPRVIRNTISSNLEDLINGAYEDDPINFDVIVHPAADLLDDGEIPVQSPELDTPAPQKQYQGSYQEESFKLNAKQINQLMVEQRRNSLRHKVLLEKRNTFNSRR